MQATVTIGFPIPRKLGSGARLNQPMAVKPRAELRLRHGRDHKRVIQVKEAS
jgi:hypothetical protein